MQKTLSTGNSHLSYQVEGTGPTVVLIHGFGEDSRIWNHQVAALKDKYQFITPDLRGSGRSTMNDQPITIESMAVDIHQILIEEKVQQCIVLGHSMGGYITLALAENNPTYLKAFGLIHSTAYADNAEKIEARRKSIQFIHEHGVGEFMKTTIPNLFAASFKEKHKEKVDALIVQSLAFSKETIIGYYEAMIGRPDRTTVLTNTKVPVLFFIGEEDKAVNPKDALEQSIIPAISKVHVEKHIAHMGMWEATGMLNKTIEEFLQFVEK